MRLYSLLDLKTDVYSAVMMAHSDAHMARTLEETFRGTGNTIEKYPEDYDLYVVAWFNNESGKVEGELKFITNLAVILPPKENGNATR